MLAPELASEELAVAQSLRQERLRIGRLAPQLTRAIAKLGAHGRHGALCSGCIREGSGIGPEASPLPHPRGRGLG
jgi:hypothetical protein